MESPIKNRNLENFAENRRKTPDNIKNTLSVMTISFKYNNPNSNSNCFMFDIVLSLSNVFEMNFDFVFITSGSKLFKAIRIMLALKRHFNIKEEKFTHNI